MLVIPAQAGIQWNLTFLHPFWIPAFAGMTSLGESFSKEACHLQHQTQTERGGTL